jgi:hypothetical protein
LTSIYSNGGTSRFSPESFSGSQIVLNDTNFDVILDLDNYRKEDFLTGLRSLSILKKLVDVSSLSLDKLREAMTSFVFHDEMYVNFKQLREIWLSRSDDIVVVKIESMRKDIEEDLDLLRKDGRQDLRL